MTVELWALLGTIAILWVAILAQQIALDKAVGAQYALSNREQGHNFKGATPLHGRLTRTVRNHVENLAIFAPLVLIAAAAGASNVWTQYAAIAFFISRFLHFFFYTAGITPFRSFAWAISFFLAIGGFVFGLVTA
ncbi:MAG: MAPEG family protein [Leptolyngbyaceae cyanobacterium MO_188.B28]|nr:MAPEG family protein [Leptolyngbyaceae cyanobacterium MO_188.B28]